MSDTDDTTTSRPDTAHTSTRRQMLQRGALVGGALVWATPVVQGIGGVAFAAGSEQPARYGYTLSTSQSGSGAAGVDAPNIDLTNNSDPGIFITSFTLTIGNAGKNFDKYTARASVGIGPGDYTVTGPDTSDNNTRSDVLTVTFASGSFAPDDIFRIKTEIDKDSSNSNEDYRTVFFNNGSSPNSQITVFFSNGNSLTQPLADQTPGNQTTYSFTQSN